MSTSATPGPGYFEDRATPNKKMFVDAGTPATDIPLEKRHIFVNGNSPQTPVNLPNVSAAEGYEFIVEAINVPGTTDAGVAIDYGDGVSGSQVANVTTEGEKIAFKCNGQGWNVGSQN